MYFYKHFLRYHKGDDKRIISESRIPIYALRITNHDGYVYTDPAYHTPWIESEKELRIDDYVRRDSVWVYREFEALSESDKVLAYLTSNFQFDRVRDLDHYEANYILPEAKESRIIFRTRPHNILYGKFRLPGNIIYLLRLHPHLAIMDSYQMEDDDKF